MGIIYDPTGIATSNSFTSEIVAVINSPMIPTKHPPFYAEGLVVRGKKNGQNIWVILKLYVDYVYSPLFSSVADKTGKEVYSYILLTDYTKWSSLSLTYHAVGGDSNLALNSRIVSAGDFDRTDINNWLVFDVTMDSFPIVYRDFTLKNRDINFMFANRLANIAKELQTPNKYLSFLNGNFGTINTTLSSLQAQLNSLTATLATNGIIPSNSVIDDTIFTYQIGTPDLGHLHLVYITKNDLIDIFNSYTNGTLETTFTIETESVNDHVHTVTFKYHFDTGHIEVISISVAGDVIHTALLIAPF